MFLHRRAKAPRDFQRRGLGTLQIWIAEGSPRSVARHGRAPRPRGARATLSLSGVLRSVPFPPYTASVFVGAANERADARGPAVIQGWEETFRALGFGGFGKVVREQVKI